MAKLSGAQILKEVEEGTITLEPFHKEQLNANSYNLRLGRTLLVYNVALLPGQLNPDLIYELNQNDPHVLDMRRDNPTTVITIPDHGYVLRPGICYLGHTEEYTETHERVPIIEGRSSVGRLGISVHATAGFGDVGFCGDWTLEISVLHPVRVYAGVEICQIAYEPLVGEKTITYKGKYQNQRGPKSSGLWRDFLKGKT